MLIAIAVTTEAMICTGKAAVQALVLLPNMLSLHATYITYYVILFDMKHALESSAVVSKPLVVTSDCTTTTSGSEVSERE